MLQKNCHLLFFYSIAVYKKTSRNKMWSLLHSQHKYEVRGAMYEVRGAMYEVRGTKYEV